MKKFLLGAIVASIVATPALAAPGYDHGDRHDRRTVVVERDVHVRDVRHAPPRAAYRHWRKGERFDRRYAANYRVVDNYRFYRLGPPPRGYHYVRSGNDALLVGVTSGIIAGVIAGAIH